MKLFVKLGTQGKEPALVAGLRPDRKAQGSRRLASRFANWIRDQMLRDSCPDTGCGLKVYRRKAFLALPYFTSMHRYLPAFFLTYGHEIAYQPVNDRPRLQGASKYSNFGRALVGLYDLVGVSWLRKRTHIVPIAEELSARCLGDSIRREPALADGDGQVKGVEGT
jgi:dolichol-phosphate mannosyltransferase